MGMKLSLSYEEFAGYVPRQLNHLFPDGRSLHKNRLRPVLDEALERAAYCFRHVKLPAYQKDGEPCLHHLHSDQYAVFLWFLSNSIWKHNGDTEAADKVFYANKALHGFSCLYDTALPDIFLLLHTTGTVLGKASYGNFLAVAQSCTVGAQDGCYPVMGSHVALLPGSSVIGQCRVGDYSSVGIGAAVYKQDIPDRSVVYRDSASGRLTVKPGLVPWTERVFHPGG
jgi:serine O-acetyltransferase